MLLNRRTFAQWAGTALAPVASLVASTRANAEKPPIRIIVGFPPGQSSDNIARSIAAKMGEQLKQSIFIDNKPGAAGIISHQAARDAAPDGSNLLMGSSGTLAINPSLYKKLPYDPLRDFEPVGLVSASPLVLFTATNSAASSVKDLLARAKAHPGQVVYGSPGNGTTAHITMEMFKQATGAELVHVPYKGSPPMITDIVGGRVDFAFEPSGSIVPFSKTGRVKLIGVATAKRLKQLPDLPTIAEQGVPGFEALAWSGLMAPKGTPPAIVQALNIALNKALKDPAVIAEMETNGSQPLGGSPADFQRFLQTEIARWSKAVKASGATVD